MSLEKRQVALNKISQLKAQASDSPVFKQISLQSFTQDLNNRVQNPDGINQSHLNVCGAATFARFWLMTDPENFVQTAFDLYNTGKAQYKNVPLTAHMDMHNNATNLNTVDWLVASSLQNAGGLAGYSPVNEMGGLRGIALPTKVQEWMAALPNMTSESVSRAASIDAINNTIQSGGFVAFLVNVNALDNYFTNKSYRNEDLTFTQKIATMAHSVVGNHYVALNSEITAKEDGTLRFEVWTWGVSLEVIMPQSELAITITQTYLIRPTTLA